MKIYILNYTCGSVDERVSCYHHACDLCIIHNKLYYTEKDVNKDELYDLLNLYESNNGNYIHISTVKPEGWKSEEEYFGFK